MGKDSEFRFNTGDAIFLGEVAGIRGPQIPFVGIRLANTDGSAVGIQQALQGIAPDGEQLKYVVLGRDEEDHTQDVLFAFPKRGNDREIEHQYAYFRFIETGIGGTFLRAAGMLTTDQGAERVTFTITGRSPSLERRLSRERSIAYLTNVLEPKLGQRGFKVGN